jgi:hypothetical protein
MRQFLFFKFIIFFFTLFIVIDGYSQDETTSPFFISLNYRTGKNIPHREIIKNLRYPYHGVDFKMGWQTIGRQDWQQAFRYPSLGVGVNWNTFDTEILGEPVALYFFTNFPQITTRWVRLDLEVDFGLSYGINPYNQFTNPNNFSTGSSVNSIFGLYLEQSFHVSPQTDLFICEGFTHYSNGALVYPNLGLNIPSLKFGIRYSQEQPQYVPKTLNKSFKKNFSIVTYLGFGTKKMDAPTPSYNEILVSPSLFFRAGYKRRIGVGFEVAYNQAIIWLDKYSNPNKTYSIDDLITCGIHFSHEFIINRFTILTQLGIYIKNQPSDKFYFERLGIGYYLNKNIRMVLNVKAHYIKAEYIEAGLTYDLNLN